MGTALTIQFSSLIGAYQVMHKFQNKKYFIQFSSISTPDYISLLFFSFLLFNRIIESRRDCTAAKRICGVPTENTLHTKEFL